MDTNRIPKQALQYKAKGPRNIGRPRKRRRDQLHLRIKEQETRLTLQEHDDDDDDEIKCSLSFYEPYKIQFRM